MIPESILPTVVDLTDRHLPALYQPDKAIQLLDAACASCAIAQPPAPEVTDAAVLTALSDTLGYRVATAGSVTVATVRDRLAAALVGQDQVVDSIARAFVAGLDQSLRETGDARPRGVFFFGGPTGVGKTAAAHVLAEVLGGGRQGLIQVDCNTLLGSGFDSGPAVNRLLGVPPGFVGYAPGQGICRASATARAASSSSTNSRRPTRASARSCSRYSTTAALRTPTPTCWISARRSSSSPATRDACYGGKAAAGFAPRLEGNGQPRVDATLLWEDLRRLGLGQEFQGRIHHQFFFQALDRPAIREVISRHLAHLAGAGARRGWRLEWADETVECLLGGWQHHLGARDIIGVVRTRVEEELRLAGAEGDMAGVDTIRLVPSLPAEPPPVAAPQRQPRRRRDGATLQIAVA